MFPASTANYTVLKAKQGILLCDKSALHAMCVLQRGFNVNKTTYAFLGAYSTYAPNDFVYYVDVVAFLQKNPTYNFELSQYLKAYTKKPVFVFDLTEGSPFVTELDNVVSFFEKSRPNPLLVNQPVPAVLSHVRMWVAKDRQTNRYLQTRKTMQCLKTIGTYELCRIVTAESALEILQVVYRDTPQLIARGVKDFKDRRQLLFGLFTTEDRSPLAVFELKLNAGEEPPQAILLPRDKSKLAKYTLSSIVTNLPDNRADRKLILDEIKGYVPKALDYLYRTYSVKVSLNDFCQTRSGAFQFLSESPADPYALFQNVSVVGGKYRLPDGYTNVKYESFSASGCTRLLLPNVVADTVRIDRCKSVSITKLVARSVVVQGGLYGELSDLKNISCKLNADIEADSLVLLDVALGQFKIDAKNLALVNVKNLRLYDKENQRLVNCQRLSLNVSEQYSAVDLRFPAVRELELDTFDGTQIVNFDREVQFPSLSKLTLRCGVVGTIGHVDSVTLYTEFGQPIPEISADVCTVYATDTWESPIKCNTLKLIYRPALTQTNPGTITVASRTDFMYNGPQRYLGTRDFINRVYVYPTNVAQWKGATLRAAHVYFYFDAKAAITKVFEDFFSNFAGNVHIILSPDAVVPRRNTVSDKFKFWRLTDGTKPDVDAWDDLRHFITHLKPAKD